MSKLNNAIKPWLLANGFNKIQRLPDYISMLSYEYNYSNGEDYIYFDESYRYISACFSIDGTECSLSGATANEVIAYFIKYGNTPQQTQSTIAHVERLCRCTSNDVDITARCVADDLLAIELINNGWHTEIKLNKQQAGQLAQYLVAFACSADMGVVKE